MVATKTFPPTAAIPERSTFLYGVDLSDPDDQPVTVEQIDHIYLSLRDIRTDTIINSRTALEVKNTNGGTLTTGRFEFQFVEDDMPAIGEEELQPRKLTLDIRLVGGGRVTRQVFFWVQSMEDIDS